MLGLPDGVRACLFDLDGVLTETAKVHAAAWKQMFDAYLQEYAKRTGKRQPPFDAKDDYDEYVDGKPRYDGVRSFLRSRGIDLPEGVPDDPPDRETVCGLGNRKNEIVLRLIREHGVEPYPGSVRYLQAAVDAGLRRAVVSSSTNCKDVLKAAGLEHLAAVGARGDDRGSQPGVAYGAHEQDGARVRVRRTFAEQLEDALAGVEAGRAGRFGCVVGVDRVDQADALRSHGADVVVADLADLLDAS